MNLLTQVLTRDQQAAGMYLEEDDHCVYLKHTGKTLSVFSTYCTIQELRQEADQQLCWLKSGIEFREVR